jgi:hypothetical protein
VQEADLSWQKQECAGDSTHGAEERYGKGHERRQKYPGLDSGYGKGYGQIHSAISPLDGHNHITKKIGPNLQFGDPAHLGQTPRIESADKLLVLAPYQQAV